MVTKKALQLWIENLPDEEFIGIDEGGLTLVTANQSGQITESWFEIGGIAAIDDDIDTSWMNP